MPVIVTKKEVVETAEAGDNGEEIKSGKYPGNLAQVPCIQYLINFQKKFVLMLAFFDSGDEVNAIHLTFAQELGLSIRSANIKAQKIDGIILDIYGIVIAGFSMTDKVN